MPRVSATDPILNHADQVGRASRAERSERVTNKSSERRNAEAVRPVTNTVKPNGQRQRCPLNARRPHIKITAHTAEPRTNEDDGGDDADQRRLNQPRRSSSHAALFQAQQSDHSCLYTGRAPSAKRQQHRQQRRQRGRPSASQPQGARLPSLQDFVAGTRRRSGKQRLLTQVVDSLPSSARTPAGACLGAHLSARLAVVETFPKPCDVSHRAPPLLVRDSGADTALAMESSPSAA